MMLALLRASWLEFLQRCLAESEQENKCVFIPFKKKRKKKGLTGVYTGGERPPVREGVLGEVQVGEVSTAASQQGPKQLAGKHRDTER